MPSTPVLRTVLRVLAVGSIAVTGFQLAVAARSLEGPSNDAVRLAGLALPLLFAAFLNLIVWTQDSPRKNTRMYTHFSNALLLVASVLVMRAIPVAFSFVVVACGAALSVIGILFEMNAKDKHEVAG